jgi:hypothetical protein
MNSPLTRQRDFRLDDVQISSDLLRDNEIRIFDPFRGATWRWQCSMKSTLIPCLIASGPMWLSVNMRVMTTITGGRADADQPSDGECQSVCSYREA